MRKEEVKLMSIVRPVSSSLLASTSGIGNGLYHPKLAEAADFILIHGNECDSDEYHEKVGMLLRYGKPVVFNEEPDLERFREFKRYGYSLAPGPILEEIKPGDVIVIDASGTRNCGFLGSNNCLAMIKASCRYGYKRWMPRFR